MMKEVSEHRKMVAASARLRSGQTLVSNLSTQAFVFVERVSLLSLDTTHTVFYHGHLLKVCTQIIEPPHKREILSTLHRR